MGLIVGVWIARYLGPDQYGLWSYILAYTALFTAFSTLGLDTIVVRDLAKGEQSRHIILGSAFLLKIIGSLIGLILIIAVISFVRPDEKLAFLLAGLSGLGFVFQSFNVIDYYYQSHTRSKQVVISTCIAFTCSSIVKVILILNNAPLIAFAVIGLIEIVLTSMLLIISYSFENNDILKWRYDQTYARRLLKDSWPFLFSSFAVLIYMRIDQVMIGQILGDTSVGVYSAGIKLTEIWNFLPIIVINSYFPSIIKTKEASHEQYKIMIQKIFSMVMLISLLISIPLTAFSSKVITLLYGVEYQDAGSVLAICIWSNLFVFMGVVSGRVYLIENLHTTAFYRSLGGMITNITLNLLWIPQFGIIGAALATLCSTLFASLIFDYLRKSTRRIFYYKLQSFRLKGIIS